MRFVVAVVLAVTVVVEAAAQTESIAEIRVHGNRSVAEAEILTLAGLQVGEPADAERLAQAERLLRESGRFETAEVRRRYRSIENPSEILIIIMVDERGPARPLWLPIVAKREGHALTFGARVAFVDAFGPRTRVSAPFTWGGERRAAVDVEHQLGVTSPGTVRASAGIARTVNPHFDVADERREVRVQAERAFTPWLRAGGGARVAEVDFGGAGGWQRAFSAHATIDTRQDPAFPRNAVHATFQLSRVKAARRYESAPTYDMDMRGYVGLVGPAVLALRAQGRHAGGDLPQYEWALLGGGESVRGYRAGYRAGENLAAISAELRVPVTSPLAAARAGVRTFIDAGAAWRDGPSIRKQQFDRGLGAGVFFAFAAVSAGLDVGWPRGGRPRVHVQLGIRN